VYSLPLSIIIKDPPVEPRPRPAHPSPGATPAAIEKPMTYEIEIKYRLADHDQLSARLQALGATLDATSTQADAYWNHPARDFAQTSEAFRVRQIGERNLITYKGPRLGGPAKTREEIEIAFEPGEEAFEDMQTLLARLGFRPVGLVRKTRTTYRLMHDALAVLVSMDLVEGLGAFAEVEVMAQDAGEISRLQAAVKRLGELLGLTEVESRSYLRMTLEGLRGSS